MDKNCINFESWLEQTSDQPERALPAEWLSHLAQCARCASRWQGECLVDLALRAWRTDGEWAHGSSILVEVTREPRYTVNPSQRPSSVPPSLVIGSVAACLLLVMYQLFFWSAGSGGMPTAGPGTSTPSTVPGEPVSPWIQSLLNLNPPRLTAEESPEMSSHKERISELLPVAPAPWPLPPQDPPSTRDWLERWQKSVREGFEFLQASLPRPATS